ncbi:MAG: efflux RND transporter periplasmic adaptor subunit [Pseudomonadota bacterium]
MAVKMTNPGVYSRGEGFPGKRGPRAKLFVFVLVPLVLLFAASACERKAPQRAGRPPVPVRLGQVRVADAPLAIGGVGSVRPLASVAVKSRVTGYLHQIHFKAGTEVQRGSLLFTLDKTPFQLALKLAEANLDRDRVAAANADRESRRYNQLSSSAATAETRDQKAAAAAMAAHDVAAGQAQAAIARQNLEYCTIMAPIAGRTGNRLIDEGNLITAYSEPLVVINQIQPIKVQFSVPQKELATIAGYSSQGGLKVRAFISGQEDRPEEGVLTFIDNQINQETGMIDLEGTFENREKRLWPGQFVKVSLLLTVEGNTVQAPYQAVERGPKGYFVFICKEDQTVEVRLVQRGRRIEDYQVIAAGLSGGEMVVVDGQMNLNHGAKVVVVGDSKGKDSRLGGEGNDQGGGFK